MQRGCFDVRTQLHHVSDGTHNQKTDAHRLTDLQEFPPVRYGMTIRQCLMYSLNPGSCRGEALRFVHLFMNCVPSRKKSLGISAISFNWSAILVVGKRYEGD